MGGGFARDVWILEIAKNSRCSFDGEHDEIEKYDSFFNAGRYDLRRICSDQSWRSVRFTFYTCDVYDVAVGRGPEDTLWAKNDKINRSVIAKYIVIDVPRVIGKKKEYKNILLRIIL